MSIINRDLQFIYLKSHKTASTSCEIHLILNSPLGDDIYYTSREILENNIPRAKNNRTLIPGQSRFWHNFPDSFPFLEKIRGMHRVFPALLQHDTLERIKFLFGSYFFNNSYKVTSIRNPWDALVSFYHWEVSGQQGRKQKKNIDWNAFVKNVLNKDKEGMSIAQSFLFYPYMFLQDQKVLDNVIYFEDIHGSFLRVSKEIGIDIDEFKKSQIHLKKSIRKDDYRIYYSDDQAERVSIHFNKYLNHFPYEFDKPFSIPT